MEGVEKAPQGNFFEERKEKENKGGSMFPSPPGMPGMPPVSRRPRPRPQSPSTRRSSLFAKYGKVGEGFKKFQDNIKHLHTPPKKFSNKVLPINPETSANRIANDGAASVSATPTPPKDDGNTSSSKKKKPSPSSLEKTPPVPKKLNWEAFAGDLTRDLTFSQKRHHHRRHRDRQRSEKVGSNSKESDTPGKKVKDERESPASSSRLSEPEKAARGRPSPKAKERKKRLEQENESLSINPLAATPNNVKGKNGLNFDETFPGRSLSVSHTLYNNLEEVASTSSSASGRRRRRRDRVGAFSLSWCSHLNATGKSSKTPLSAPSGRMGHSQTGVDFTLFVFGGATGGKFMNDLWLYNAETLSWCKKPSIGSVPSPRGYHSTNTLYSGRKGDSGKRVIFFGGWDGTRMFNDMFVVENCEDLLYRKSSLFKQIKVENAPMARAMHSMTTIYLQEGQSSQANGSNADAHAHYQQALILFGGWSRQSFLNDMHVYNVASERWSKVTYKNRSASAATGIGGRGGGDDGIPAPRGSHTCVAVKDHLFVFGGQLESGPSNELWTFCIQTSKWNLIEQEGHVPSPRSGHAAVLLDDRYMLIFGGYNGEKHLSDMFVLDTEAMSWEQKTLPLGHPLGRSAHALSLVGEERVYMTFGWSPHGVLCDVHALDTREGCGLKKVTVTGGPYTSTLCQLTAEFSEKKKKENTNRVDAHGSHGGSKSSPISIQWFRSKNGKPFAPIEGATTSVYMPTADDVNARLGVSCLPCDPVDLRTPLGPSHFAMTQDIIEVDPELGGLVKSFVGQDKAKFSVNLLSVENVVAKMYLIFTSTCFELRTKAKTSFKEEYQTSFRVILSAQNPYTFVLQVHQGLSLPFAVQHIMERDLLALTARSFWALALKNSLME